MASSNIADLLKKHELVHLTNIIVTKKIDLFGVELSDCDALFLATNVTEFAEKTRIKSLIKDILAISGILCDFYLSYSYNMFYFMELVALNFFS